MNTQITQLLEQVANKFNTTVEHLWTVLVKQAPISSVASLLSFILVSAVTYRVAKTIFQLLAKEQEENTCSDAQILLSLLLIGVSLAYFFVVASFCINIDMILAGFFNPEYWAIKQILK